MSKKQWGHGYYKGVEDTINGKGKPKYLVAKDKDGYWWRFFIIREIHDDIWVIENFTEYSQWLQLSGMPYDFDEDEIDVANYEEININDFPTEYKLFYSKYAAIGFLVRAIEEFEKEKKYEKSISSY